MIGTPIKQRRPIPPGWRTARYEAAQQQREIDALRAPGAIADPARGRFFDDRVRLVQQ